mgnify:CR=1 FL=1
MLQGVVMENYLILSPRNRAKIQDLSERRSDENSYPRHRLSCELHTDL